MVQLLDIVLDLIKTCSPNEEEVNDEHITTYPYLLIGLDSRAFLSTSGDSGKTEEYICLKPR